MELPQRPQRWQPLAVVGGVLLAVLAVAAAAWFLPDGPLGAALEDHVATAHLHVAPERGGDHDVFIPLPGNASADLFASVGRVDVQYRNGAPGLRVILDHPLTLDVRVPDHGGPDALSSSDFDALPAASVIEGDGAVQFFIHARAPGDCSVGEMTLWGVASPDGGWTRVESGVAVC